MKLIKFYATWCQPCKQMAPIFDKFAAQNDTIDYVEIDVDANEEAAKKFGIKGLPTFILVDEDLNPLLRLSGTMNEEVFFRRVNEAINDVGGG